MSILNPSLYADHQGHRFNLSGTHRGNRFCLDCSTPVGVPDTFDEDMASASVPVVAVVTGEGVAKVANMARLMAYRTWGQTGMKLARNFAPTVKGWNAEHPGSPCRTRAQVGTAAEAEIKRIRAERDGK